jgi:hypothetical protein
MPREIRAELRPQDQLHLDFSESAATHCIACHTPTGELKIAPIESACSILNDWRRRPFVPESTPVFNVYVLGSVKDALQDGSILSGLDLCIPVLFTVESEDDAELLADGLRRHLRRLGLAAGRH